MNALKLPYACLRAALLTVMTLSAANATELVYTPRNPSFGGNPNNGPNLLSDAQAQNSTKAPTLTPLEQFNKSLQQAILSRIQSNALNSMFGAGNTLVAKSYDTSTYTVNVTDLGGGKLQIDTIDKTTGATASFTVDQSGLTN